MNPIIYLIPGFSTWQWSNSMWKRERWLTFLVFSKCWIFQEFFQPLTVIQQRSVVRPADTGNTTNAGGRDPGISLSTGLLFVRINGMDSYIFLSAQEQVIFLILECCLLEYILMFWKIQTFLTCHCANIEEKSKVFSPKLLFLPPCWFGCMNGGGPLFQFNRGQRAQRKGWLSHTESSHT